MEFRQVPRDSENTFRRAARPHSNTDDAILITRREHIDTDAHRLSDNYQYADYFHAWRFSPHERFARLNFKCPPASRCH